MTSYLPDEVKLSYENSSQTIQIYSIDRLNYEFTIYKGRKCSFRENYNPHNLFVDLASLEDLETLTPLDVLSNLVKNLPECIKQKQGTVDELKSFLRHFSKRE